MRPDSRTLALPCRYYRVYTDDDVSCDEQNFGFVTRTLPIPIDQTALVLVDVWNTHYIGSWLRRAQEVTRTRIVPLLEAARCVGLTVIHGPSPQVADRYVSRPPAPAPLSAPVRPDWPSPAFRGIYRSGEYAPFGRNPEPRLKAALDRYVTELDIDPATRPLPGEPVIHSGAQMHELLADRGILHPIYAGFATNWCVIGRDYGILAMNERGYNILLVRDATTGIEFHDTVDSLAATAMTIREVETKYAWSLETADFLRACEQLDAT